MSEDNVLEKKFLRITSIRTSSNAFQMKLKENDIIQNAEVFLLENGEPVKKDITKLLKSKKVILFGLPGAYTSICSGISLF